MSPPPSDFDGITFPDLPPISTTRIVNALRRGSFKSLLEVAEVPDEELLRRCRGLGKKGLTELKQGLTSLFHQSNAPS